MIRIQRQIEPAYFDNDIRRLGNRWVARNRHRPLSSGDFPNYWSKCLADLRLAYRGICAYTASYIELDAGHGIGSVDHFIPKTEAYDLVYEWNNYRFCNPRVNGNKDNSLAVLDPFFVTNGWFVLDFKSFSVHPAKGLPEVLKNRIQETIDILKLNDDDRIVNPRIERITEYAHGHISFDYLERRYPFLAMELDRQGLKDAIKTMIP